MRVIFLGNCDDSPEYAETLVGRSNDPADPLDLAAIICPLPLEARRDALVFAAKRRVDRTAHFLPNKVSNLIQGTGGGLGQRMQGLADSAGVPVMWSAKVSTPEVCATVQALNADVAIVAGLGEILREPVFSSFPPLFNIHPALLPHYRGGMPEFWQLEDGAIEGGVTIHRLVPGVDTGPIILQERFALEPWIDSAGLLAHAATAGIDLMNRLVDGFPGIADEGTAQEGGSHQPLPKPEDYLVPFDRSAHAVFNRARAAGFRNPLVVNVPAHSWLEGGPVSGLAAAAADTLGLHLHDPIPFPDHVLGTPGDLRRIPGGGVAVSCNPGTVVFQTVTTI